MTRVTLLQDFRSRRAGSQKAASNLLWFSFTEKASVGDVNVPITQLNEIIKTTESTCKYSFKNKNLQ